MGWDFSARDFVLGVVAGGVITLVLLSISAIVLLRSSDTRSLGHWTLNTRTPLPSMWMNLGYWQTYDGKPIVHFDEAARALLERILDKAGLLVGNNYKADALRESVAVLDLGFGCGDQTTALAEMMQAQRRPHFKYVGLSLDASQVRMAQRTLDRTLTQDAACANGLTQDSFTLFCADAAKPETWTPVIRTSVDGLTDKVFSSQRWMLALDCLYHFSPSRRSAFRLAAETLGAKIMAFDLILNEEAPWWESMLVRGVGLLMNCPLYTFMTEGEYRAQLVECGYDEEDITIDEISDHVFAGVSEFLRRQESALGQYGIGMGGFKLAGRLFECFNRTRVVKAVIVVAGRTKAGRT